MSAAKGLSAVNIAAVAALLLCNAAIAAVTSSELPLKRGLVIGNANYQPDRLSIPSAAPAASQVAAALAAHGFTMSYSADEGTQQMRRSFRTFFAGLRDRRSKQGLAFVYYVGHGFTYQDELFVVPADVRFDQPPAELARQSLSISREILSQIDELPPIVLLFEIDRSDPTQGTGKTTTFVGGPAAAGSIVMFSSGPGRVSVAPKSTTEISFFATALVAELRAASSTSTIVDVLERVRSRTKRTMDQHPDKFVRTFAQEPEIVNSLGARITFDGVDPMFAHEAGDAGRAARQQRPTLSPSGATSVTPSANLGAAARGDDPKVLGRGARPRQ